MCRLSDVKCPNCNLMGFLREEETDTFPNPECTAVSIINKRVVCDHCDAEFAELHVDENNKVIGIELKNTIEF